MRDRFDLRGKVALVTGASKEMGAALAATLAEYGADVALTARDLPGLEKAAGRVTAFGRRAMVVPADLLDMSSIPVVVNQVVRELGGLDILVNVAGGGPWSNFGWAMRLTEQQWDDMFALNVKSAFFLSQAAALVMRERGGGSIVNISSGAGSTASPRMANYGAAKAALDNVSATMAAEWGQFGIRVNVVVAGVIDTANTREGLFPTPEKYGAVQRSSALGRIGLPDDIASAVLYLVSPAAAWVTGATLSVNGGMRAARLV